ncbi:hypothetical protein CPB84DRAFT_1850929 [Gymnopilus junonius]|uniref:Uncharacterized protein n=1 Tax=Gymnopilus junonius TaxID=109634 RepID=A0A9P5NGL0_GYMJU|nr:hypothetical protein CPB84DRAFT_1850929 [Gymnopilus junonius]
MTAKFITTDQTKVTCTIDGQPQLVSSLDTLGGAQCTSNRTLHDGSHQLVIGLDGTGSGSSGLSLFFDGLMYAPSSSATTTGDVFITSDPSLNLGQTTEATEWHWDFDFIGYSMSLYINYNSELSVVRTNGSYTIDGNGPYNFTTADPLFSSTAPQLLVQTPRYDLGSHKFHLDYTHENEIIPFSFYGIMVQNTTSTVDLGLQVVPPVPSSTPPASSTSTSPSGAATTTPTQSQSTATPTQYTLPIIIGSVVGGVVLIALLLLLFWFIRRRKRYGSLSPMEDDIDDINPVVHPFQRQSILNLNKAEEAEHGNNPNMSEVNISNSTSTSATRPHQVRVVIHEDSGQQVAQPDEEPEEEVVELPPNYTSLWRGGTMSSRAGDAEAGNARTGNEPGAPDTMVDNTTGVVRRGMSSRRAEVKRSNPIG